ncbi:CBR-WRK-1 protein [Aphelenchoides avenae]|nr:CBR-WRK-1 protein [Aphelenchus avenae]
MKPPNRIKTIIAFVAITGVHAAPQITSPGRKFEVLEHGSVGLPCNVEGQDEGTVVIWMRGDRILSVDREITATEETRLALNVQDDNFMLTISSLVPSDSDVYECSVSVEPKISMAHKPMAPTSHFATTPDSAATTATVTASEEPSGYDSDSSNESTDMDNEATAKSPAKRLRLRRAGKKKKGRKGAPSKSHVPKNEAPKLLDKLKAKLDQRKASTRKPARSRQPPAAAGQLAPSAAEEFEDPPDNSVDDSVARLGPSTGGWGGTALATVKKCRDSYAALRKVGNVLHSCVIQAEMRFYRNFGCFHEYVRECNSRADCNNTEVQLVHDVLSNPNIGLKPYMEHWGYVQGKFQDHRQVISNSLICLSRKNCIDPKDDTLSPLGRKMSLYTRVLTKGDKDGKYTHLPFQPMIDEATDRDFSGNGSLVEAILGGVRAQFHSSSVYGKYFTKFLNRPQGTQEDYYENLEIKLYAHPQGKSAERRKIPGVITHLVIRFPQLPAGEFLRKIPAFFDNGGRTFKLVGLMVHNKERNHAYNVQLKWKGAEYTCWELGKSYKPLKLEDKRECTQNRVIWAGYVALGSDWN